MASSPFFVDRDSGGSIKALQEGAYIRRAPYGLGVMAASDAERAPLDLDLHGLKEFVAKLMVAELPEGTPGKWPKTPKKPTRAGRTAGAK